MTTPIKTVAQALATVPARETYDNDTTYFIKLQNHGRNSQVMANACSVKAGLDLMARSDYPAKGAQRGEWQAARATELQIGPRQLRTILAAAAAIEELTSRLGDRAPVSALNRPLDGVAVAVKNLLASRGADEAAERKPRAGLGAKAWTGRAGKLLQQLPLLAEPDREVALAEHLRQLDSIRPGILGAWNELKDEGQLAATVADTRLSHPTALAMAA